MDKPQIILHVQKCVNYTLYDSKWIPCSAKFVALGNYARGTGALQIYEVSHGDVKVIKDVEKSKPFKCGTFGASGLQNRYLATGDFTGKLQIWNLESLDLPVYSVQAHKEIINSIDGVGGLGIGEGAPEIVTGSRDGIVKVWDPRQKDEPVATMEPEEGEAKRDCWTVAFGDAYSAQERCVAAGYDNGDIKLFDLRNMALRWETNVKNGPNTSDFSMAFFEDLVAFPFDPYLCNQTCVCAQGGCVEAQVCCLEFDRKDIAMNKLVATTLESKFYVYDMRTQHPSKGFASLTEKAHSSTVWLARHLPQNRDVFMTLGGNGSLNLWKYSYPSSRTKTDSEGVQTGVAGTIDLLQNVTLSTQPVSSFDWSPDKQGLSVCTSFDQTIRVIITTKLNTV